MPIVAEPASLDKEDLVPWAVKAKGYTGQKATFASAAAQDAYDWMSARAGMLNPDQVDAQQKACAAYVRQLAEARSSAVGSAAADIGPDPDGDGPVDEAHLAEIPEQTLPDGSRPVGLGFILTWILASLIWNIVSLLFWKIVNNHKNMTQWKTMHSAPNL